MTSPSFRDMETLSAYLDGQIDRVEKTHLERRIQSDATLAAALQGLRQTRALIQRTPKRQAPRNFTLTARMAGIRPPVPRLVPAFSWASALAMVLFIFTVGTSLVGRLSFGAAAPMLARPASGIGGGPPAAAPMASTNPEAATAAPATAAPSAKGFVAQGTTDQSLVATPTAEISLMAVPAPAQPATANVNQPSSTLNGPQTPPNPWLFIWSGLGITLGLLALITLWLNLRAFRRKNLHK
jgi:anti-sigma factor RsiW